MGMGFGDIVARSCRRERHPGNVNGVPAHANGPSENVNGARENVNGRPQNVNGVRSNAEECLAIWSGFDYVET